MEFRSRSEEIFYIDARGFVLPNAGNIYTGGTMARCSESGNPQLSFPISPDSGYYILIVWKFTKQGQTPEMPMVEQEIRGRLTVERRRKLFDQFVQNLRAKHAIEVFVNSTSDSGKRKENNRKKYEECSKNYCF